MGLLSTLKPRAPSTLSIHELTDQELNDRRFDDRADSTISTNPETVMMALEDRHVPSARREALQQLMLGGDKPTHK